MINSEYIKEAAKSSFLCHRLPLTHLLLNKENELYMTHDVSFDKIIFSHVDNSKPYNYSEFNINDEYIVDKIFHDKYTNISYEYPYIIENKPARIEAETMGIFRTGSYKLLPKSENRNPNYAEIGNIIYKALIEFNK